MIEEVEVPVKDAVVHTPASSNVISQVMNPLGSLAGNGTTPTVLVGMFSVLQLWLHG